MMISQRLSGLMSRQLSCFSSGGHQHHQNRAPIYAPSIQDKLIYLNIYNDGEFQRLPAYIGESLLTALRRFKMSGLPGTCMGGEQLDSMLENPIQPNSFGPYCTDCHVLIAAPWADKMANKHYLEQTQLNEAMNPSQRLSRLACCVLLDKWMDEMQVTIPLCEIQEEN